MIAPPEFARLVRLPFRLAVARSFAYTDSKNEFLYCGLVET
jgi:hypothetical protein